ncbi:MAG: SseB family protein [Pararhodobacter sp.]
MPESPLSPLDTAAAQMQAVPDDLPARLRFHAELAAAELFVLLETEAEGGRLRPQVFDLSEGRAVLAFDSELRLAEFAGAAVPYAALPGRVLVAMLAAGSGDAADLSLLLNAGAAQAELLPPAALRWLAQTLAGARTVEAEGRAVSFGPVALPAAALDLLRPALERRLRGMPGLNAAVLASVIWQSGARGHVLALGGVATAARGALARAVAEALEFSGLEAGALDVIYPEAAALALIAARGLALAPAPYVAPLAGTTAGTTAGTASRSAPGMDPARPPRLR